MPQPFPGLQSRPDRILVSQSIQVEAVGLDGDGSQYQRYYHFSILMNRASAILTTSFQAFQGHRGFSCLQDCGPHGSCRCGVCVTGGDKNKCETPSCPECDTKTFVMFLFFTVPIITSFVILFLALIKILVISGRFSQRDIQEILGYRCCLFNRQLFQAQVFPRRLRINLYNFCQLYHLPPFWVAIGDCIFIAIWYLLFRYILQDSIDLIFLFLPEELFPSDHRIVFAKLKL